MDVCAGQPCTSPSSQPVPATRVVSATAKSSPNPSATPAASANGVDAGLATCTASSCHGTAESAHASSPNPPSASEASSPNSHVPKHPSAGRPPKPALSFASGRSAANHRDLPPTSPRCISDTGTRPEQPLIQSSLPPVDSPARPPSTPRLSYEQQDHEHIRVQFSSAAMQGIRCLPNALAPHFRERLFAELLAIGKLRHERQQQQMRQHGGGKGITGRHTAALAPLLAHGTKAGPLQVPVRPIIPRLCSTAHIRLSIGASPWCNSLLHPPGLVGPHPTSATATNVRHVHYRH